MVYYQILNFIFQFIAQLIPLIIEKLYAVIFHRVMRCRNYDACVQMIFAHQIRHSRRWHNARQHSMRAYGADTRYKRTFQHIPADARIQTHQNTGGVFFLFCQHIRSSLTKAERQFSRQFRIRDASYAVRTKHSCHSFSSSLLKP